jgi:hypothetical protein
MDGISSYHEVTHSKVLVNKRHPHYQNELVFRSVDDRLLELTEEVFFPLSKMAPEPLLERAHKTVFPPAIGTCLLVKTLLANGIHLIFRCTELNKRPSS